MLKPNVCVISQTESLFNQALENYCNPMHVNQDIRDSKTFLEVISQMNSLKGTSSEISFVLTTNEAMVPACADLSEELSLPFISSEMAKRLRDKSELYERLNDVGVRCPKTVAIADTDKNPSYEQLPFSFPCIIKPTAGFASLNVVKIESPEILKRKLPEVRRNTSVRLGQLNLELGVRSVLLLQEYVNGQEFALDFLVLDGRVQWVEIFGRNSAQGTHFPDQLYVRLTTTETRQFFSEFSAIAQKVADAFHVKNGWMQVELIVDPGSPQSTCVIDAAYRLAGGGLNSLVIEKATGRSPLEAFLLHRSPLSSDKGDRSLFLYYLNPSLSGRFSHIEGLDDSLVKKSLVDITIHASRGDLIQDSTSSGRYVGSLICQSRDFAHALSLKEHFDHTLKIVVE